MHLKAPKLFSHKLVHHVCHLFLLYLHHHFINWIQVLPQLDQILFLLYFLSQILLEIQDLMVFFLIECMFLILRMSPSFLQFEFLFCLEFHQGQFQSETLSLILDSMKQYLSNFWVKDIQLVYLVRWLGLQFGY